MDMTEPGYTGNGWDKGSIRLKMYENVSQEGYNRWKKFGTAAELMNAIKETYPGMNKTDFSFYNQPK